MADAKFWYFKSTVTLLGFATSETNNKWSENLRKKAMQCSCLRSAHNLLIYHMTIPHAGKRNCWGKDTQLQALAESRNPVHIRLEQQKCFFFQEKEMGGNGVSCRQIISTK